MRNVEEMMMIRKLTQYFFQGLIFVVPIGLTGYVLYTAFLWIDGWLPFSIPGAGFLLIVALVTLVGFLASNFLTKSLFSIVEKILNRLPFVKLLHTSIKDFLTAFVGERKRFDKPVLVELFPGASAKALGFLTRESLESLNLADQVAVYFPQSFNFAGNLLLYPREQVMPLNTESARVMTFIVSGGLTG